MLKEISVEIVQQSSRFYQGFIELAPKLMVALLVLIIFYLVSRGLRPWVKRRLNSRLDDTILADFFSGIFHFTFVSIGFLIGIQIIGLGALVVGIFSGAGVAAIVIGLAFKDIGENFIAGVIMAFDQPFKTGDMIQLDDQRGRVRRMSIRETHIKTADGKDVFIPNARIIKGNLINFTMDGALRYEGVIGVDYGSDIARCLEIIEHTLGGIDGILPSPSASANILNYSASGLDIQFTFWIDIFVLDDKRFTVRTNAFKLVWEALNNAGFGLPGQVIEIKNYGNNPIILDTSHNS